MTARKTGGRPPFVPTDADRKMAEVLAAHGIPLCEIAKNIGAGVDVKTLRKALGNELRDARLLLKAKMIVALTQAGLNGDWRAARYWLQCHGGPEWRSTERREIRYTGAVDVSQMTNEELQSELDKLQRKRDALNRPRTWERPTTADDPGSLH